mmetsp:Transcript_32264/g.68677  ORF Transcript_32264/g.68677 Transcript_32264/m.68677 type:complete len:189 (-) Transcript_32264:63-629(-)
MTEGLEEGCRSEGSTCLPPRPGVDGPSPGGLKGRRPTGRFQSGSVDSNEHGPVPHRRLSWKDAVLPANEILELQSGSPGVALRASSHSSAGEERSAGESDFLSDRNRCQSEDKIDDRRSSPSKADHHNIINSFQQGLDSVEAIIIYDSAETSMFFDDEQEGAAQKGKRFLRKLSTACLVICGCHAVPG